MSVPKACDFCFVYLSAPLSATTFYGYLRTKAQAARDGGGDAEEGEDMDPPGSGVNAFAYLVALRVSEKRCCRFLGSRRHLPSGTPIK